jgi:ribosomal protein L37AE/L43A
MTTKQTIVAVKGSGSRHEARRARAALDAHRAEVREIVATGICPKCGRKLRSNLSLAGWWQCSQFGAIGFRADAGQPSCDWQGFTD